MDAKVSGRMEHLSGSIHQTSVSVEPYYLAQFSSLQVLYVEGQMFAVAPLTLWLLFLL